MQLGIKERNQSARAKAPVVTGLCAGTQVTTLRGDIAVEHLRVGDRIVTRDSGTATLSGVSTTSAVFTPIRIKAGSLGHARPDQDMITTPGAKIYIRDWRANALYGRKSAAVAAAQLIDGEFIAETKRSVMEITTLTFDRPHIIYADGVEMVVG